MRQHQVIKDNGRVRNHMPPPTQRLLPVPFATLQLVSRTPRVVVPPTPAQIVRPLFLLSLWLKVMWILAWIEAHPRLTQR